MCAPCDPTVPSVSLEVRELSSGAVDAPRAAASASPCKRVEVSTGAKTHFRIEGLPALSHALELRANVFRADAGALGSVSTSLGTEHTGSVVLDHTGTLSIGLAPITIDGRRWGFEPTSIPIAGGAELVFQARREPD